jgi:hypothetical protein
MGKNWEEMGKNKHLTVSNKKINNTSRIKVVTH